MPNDNSNTSTPSDADQMSAFLGAVTVDGVVQKPTSAATPAAPAAPAAPTPAQAARAAGAAAQAALGLAPSTDAPADDAGGEGDAEDADDGAADAAGKNAKVRSAQERISQAVARQRSAERERDVMRGEMTALQQRLERLEKNGLTKGDTEPKVDPNAPRAADYEYGELDVKYITALARYEARKEFAAEQAKISAAEKQREQARQATATAQRVAEFTTAGAEKYGDFEQTVIDSARSGDWPLSETLGELVLSSQFGVDIAYSLATNHKEAKRVFGLSPAQQAVWFGRQEAKISSALPDASGTSAPSGSAVSQRVTQAAAPLAHRARGAGSGSKVSPDTSDFASFEAMATGTNRAQ